MLIKQQEEITTIELTSSFTKSDNIIWFPEKIDDLPSEEGVGTVEGT